MDNANLKLTPLQTERYEIMKLIASNVAGGGVVLKGGTGLLLCYGLDRFSDDLDFDPYSLEFNFKQFQRTIEKILIENNITIERLNVKKDTETTKRIMVKYKQLDNTHGDYPLKIEISFRDVMGINQSDYHIVNGICVYKIEKLATRKLDAFNKRTRCRDIYDIAFLLKKFPSIFNKEMLYTIKNKDLDMLIEILETDKRDDTILAEVDATKLIMDMIDNIKNLEDCINLANI
jgi:predicted nucleotidyltransferase component of viral defense system